MKIDLKKYHDAISFLRVVHNKFCEYSNCANKGIILGGNVIIVSRLVYAAVIRYLQEKNFVSQVPDFIICETALGENRNKVPIDDVDSNVAMGIYEASADMEVNLCRLLPDWRNGIIDFLQFTEDGGKKKTVKDFFAENPGYKWARKMVEELVSGLEEETYDVDDVMFLISDKVPEVENKLRSNLSEEGIEKKKIFFQLFDLLSNLLPETEVKFVDGKKIIVWINYVCCDGCQQNGFMISPAAVGAGICLKHFMDQIY